MFKTIHCCKFGAQKLSWFSHVLKIPDTKKVKKIFSLKPVVTGWLAVILGFRLVW